ncbi:MAG: hypothetical protein KDB53_07785 [Planctomycetes bacterium]|nr:hypothetical protein [Planctomycetota bacterium]
MVQLMLATDIRLGPAVALDADDLDGDTLWMGTTKGDRPDRKELVTGRLVRRGSIGVHVP